MPARGIFTGATRLSLGTPSLLYLCFCCAHNPHSPEYCRYKARSISESTSLPQTSHPSPLFRSNSSILGKSPKSSSIFSRTSCGFLLCLVLSAATFCRMLFTFFVLEHCPLGSKQTNFVILHCPSSKVTSCLSAGVKNSKSKNKYNQTSYNNLRLIKIALTASFTLLFNTYPQASHFQPSYHTKKSLSTQILILLKIF